MAVPSIDDVHGKGFPGSPLRRTNKLLKSRRHGRFQENRKSRTLAISVLAVLSLSACVAGPDAPQHVAQARANQLGLATQSAGIGARWWESFDDPQLSRLIDEGVKRNPTVKAALARVRTADATVGVQRAAELPQVSADGQVLEQRFSDAYLIPPPYAGTTHWIPTVQANLDWDLDLFGRQKAVVAIARSDAEAAGLDAAEARLIISASIAQTYIGLARAQQLIRVTNEFVKTREEALALTRSKARYALASEFDQRTAETLLAQARQAELRAAAPARISTSRLRTMTTPFFAPCANRPTH